MYYSKFYVAILFLICGFYQVLAQSDFVRPSAHYPLEVYDKNPTVNYQRFLLINPWDVSGNARHGTIMGDNTLTDDKYNGFDVGKWIGEAQDNTNVANFRPCLKKSTINHSKNSYIAIPPPFGTSNISQTGFTLSFWYNPGESRNDLILTTNRLSVSVSDKIYIHHKYNGTSYNAIFPLDQNAFQLNAWTYVSLVYNHNEGKLYLFQEGYTSYSQMLSNTPKISETSENINFAEDRYSVNQICGNDFSGEISNVRFYDSPLSTVQVNEVKIIDLHWSNRTHDPNSYIEKGAFMKYDFDGGSMEELMNGLKGISYGSVTTISNRFDEADKAIHFSGTNAYVETPSFFESTKPVISYNPSVGGVTFSFWVKTDADQNYPSDPETLQNLYNNFGDNTKKIFYANNNQNDELFGMQRFEGALGQIRYTRNAQNQLQSWFFWLYDRIAFARQGDKWYHVIYVQHPNWQRMYVAKKEDIINCLCEETDINCWEHCRCAYNYQGIQDMSSATIFGFGNNQGKAIANLDDVRVYHWPLSPAEVKYLHKLESTPPSHNPVNYYRTTGSTLDDKLTELQTDASITVFPNPSSDFINIKSSEDIDSIQIISIFGQIIKYPVEKNNIDIRDLTEGIYFLRISINDTIKIIKFIKK